MNKGREYDLGVGKSALTEMNWLFITSSGAPELTSLNSCLSRYLNFPAHAFAVLGRPRRPYASLGRLLVHQGMIQAQGSLLPQLPLSPDSAETLVLESNHFQLCPPLSYFMKNAALPTLSQADTVHACSSSSNLEEITSMFRTLFTVLAKHILS